jgi:hypothetical protein
VASGCRVGRVFLRVGNESSLTSGWHTGSGRVCHGGNERCGLALLGVAEPPHARGADELMQPSAISRHEGDALQALGEPASLADITRSPCGLGMFGYSNPFIGGQVAMVTSWVSNVSRSPRFLASASSPPGGVPHQDADLQGKNTSFLFVICT